jgi:hypothetical protein
MPKKNLLDFYTHLYEPFISIDSTKQPTKIIKPDISKILEINKSKHDSTLNTLNQKKLQHNDKIQKQKQQLTKSKQETKQKQDNIKNKQNNQKKQQANQIQDKKKKQKSENDKNKKEADEKKKKQEEKTKKMVIQIVDQKTNQELNKINSNTTLLNNLQQKINEQNKTIEQLKSKLYEF